MISKWNIKNYLLTNELMVSGSNSLQSVVVAVILNSLDTHINLLILIFGCWKAQWANQYANKHLRTTCMMHCNVFGSRSQKINGNFLGIMVTFSLCALGCNDIPILFMLLQSINPLLVPIYYLLLLKS